MKDKLIFVPGFQCSVEDYPKTWRELQSAGFEVQAVSPPWGSSFNKLVSAVSQDLSHLIGPKSIILAHSQGANVAMPELARHEDIGVILASPSTACLEGCDSPEGRANAMRNYSSEEHDLRRVHMCSLAASSVSKTVSVLVGEQEIRQWPFMGQIAQSTAEGFGVSPTVIPDAPHFIDHHEAYIDTVVGHAATARALLSLPDSLTSLDKK